MEQLDFSDRVNNNTSVQLSGVGAIYGQLIKSVGSIQTLVTTNFMLDLLLLKLFSLRKQQMFVNTEIHLFS